MLVGNFISAHWEVGVMNVAEVVSESNFFSILMDGSAIQVKEKEGVYISHFKEKKSRKDKIRLFSC